MARIKGKDLYLKDDDQIYFGDNNDAALWYDDDDLRLNHTISGVDPIEDYHLTTKKYITDEDLNLVPRDGSRGFTSTVSGVNATQLYHLMTKQDMLTYLGGFDPSVSGVETSITNYEYVVSLAESQTTSTSYVTKLTLTTSGLPTGNYHLGWSFEWRQSKTNSAFWARIRHNAVDTYWEYTATPYVDVNFWNLITNFYFPTLTVTGTHVFTLEYRTASVACVSYIRNTKFEFWRIL